MAAVTTMKTALKVLHNKSPQNLYHALVHTKTEGQDEVRKLTADDLKKITEIKRKSWSLSEIRNRRLENENYNTVRGTLTQSLIGGFELPLFFLGLPSNI